MDQSTYFSSVIIIAVLALVSAGEEPSWDEHLGREYSDQYTNEWIARIDGGENVAEEIAAKLGYRYLGQVRGFPGVYRMLKEDFPKVGKRGEPRLTQRLVRDDRVMWADQQYAKQREKRGYLSTPPPPVSARAPRSPHEDSSQRKPSRLETRHLFNDELWGHQWYLQDTRRNTDMPKMDLHVIGVYRKGISGKGVRVCVLDDGIEVMHPDLRDNYDPEISLDINDEDPDPSPRYDASNSNSHGTRCAGEIAMAANNYICGVGVAFNAKIGGVRMLDGMVSDVIEGTAIGWAQDKVDIYSASWGPKDDGKTVEGPGRLALAALLNGITNGRNGKGVIFVWASGNGGSRGDDCSCDGYAASPYTLSVGSASQRGQFPWYGEKCPSTLAATYSSGEYTDQMIATTDLHGRCTVEHTGTSAAAPLAAGIIALVLEANPSLTWRDVQHLVVWTSQPSSLVDNSGWKINGAGFFINPSFGFGLMDAEALVTAAENWTNVPPQHLCTIQSSGRDNITISPTSPVIKLFYTTGCNYLLKDYLNNDVEYIDILEEGDEVNYLEHVELEASIRYSIRGALQIYLTSPHGTTVQLLKIRPADKSDRGFQRWRFMSVLTWGEKPAGRWELRIEDPTNSMDNYGLVGPSTLILRGTKSIAPHMKSGPRIYDSDYNRVHKKTELVLDQGQESVREHQENVSQMQKKDIVDEIAHNQNKLAQMPKEPIEDTNIILDEILATIKNAKIKEISAQEGL